MIDSQRRSNITQHNEYLQRNKDILKRLNNAICYLSKQKLTLRGHNQKNLLTKKII